MKIVQKGLILKTRQNRHCPNSKPKYIVFPHCYDLGLSPNNYFHSSLCGPSPHRKPKEKFKSSDLKGKIITLHYDYFYNINNFNYIFFFYLLNLIYVVKTHIKIILKCKYFLLYVICYIFIYFIL